MPKQWGWKLRQFESENTEMGLTKEDQEALERIRRLAEARELEIAGGKVFKDFDKERGQDYGYMC